jgi:hypothetical protein
MTLDGLEEIAQRAAPSNQKVNVVRYADDFIITGASKPRRPPKIPHLWPLQNPPLDELAMM